MAKGRKPKPTYLHLLDGTQRKHRTNLAEPDATPEPMVCPAWLPEGCAAHFDRVAKLLGEWGLDSAHYQDVVMSAAIRLEEVERLTAVLEEEGETYESENASGGLMVRARPEVGMRNEALRHLQSLLSELGLSPTAKSRVAGKGTTDNANAFVQD